MNLWNLSLVAILPVLAIGCRSATKPEPASQTLVQPVTQPVHQPEPRPAMALVAETPGYWQRPQIDLNRDRRGAGAVAGYEGNDTSYLYVRTDDRQREGWGTNDRFERRAIVVQERSLRR